MADLERRYNTLNEIVQKTTIRYVCPKCLRGFSRPTLLYQHFREDESHNALSMRREDFKRFLSSYQESLGCKIPAKELPPDAECFRIQYVIDHYKRDQNLANSLSTPGPNNLYADARTYISCPTIQPLLPHREYSAIVHSDVQPRGPNHEHSQNEGVVDNIRTDMEPSS
ncbi:hypothetical protein BDV41DRAFT_543132 [Aspergillus transmontanensis]|uniref:C2H2-type domain-containing protein n=1 Tax=Aspergillus transmontanensis TaxID=1034304 RepID=A0A5N6VQR4_9EURO|nr:hypothetical protein BDV41DRAFT_543132 [Aspergillus transmontanensis]